MYWIVVTIKPNQAIKAQKNLIAQKFTTFFPKVTCFHNGKIADFDLFKGYAFIKIKTYDQIKTINSTLGVNKVLRVEDKIPQVSEDIIKIIKRQIKEFNLDAKGYTPLQIHDQVTIKLKIFKDQPAEIMNIVTKKHSQKVLLKLLGSGNTIWVDQSLLCKDNQNESFERLKF